MKERKILCIEDDTFLIDLITGKFKDAGITALGAHTGAEGLVAAKAYHPDLILLDLMLPDMRGDLVLEQLKEDKETEAIPVIIFSNLGEADEIKRDIEAGAFAYLVKSNTLPGELVGIVAKELGVAILDAEEEGDVHTPR